MRGSAEVVDFVDEERDVGDVGVSEVVERSGERVRAVAESEVVAREVGRGDAGTGGDWRVGEGGELEDYGEMCGVFEEIERDVLKNFNELWYSFSGIT